MNKDALLLGVALAVLAGGGGYHYYQSQHTPPPAAAPTKLSAVGTAHPKPVAAPANADQKKAAAATATAQQQAAAAQAAHAQVEAALSSLKVSSILLGDPAVVIISKQDYGVGDLLKLPGSPGKTRQMTGINDGGVTLTADGQNYHLDAPAAPDLAASRKK